MQMILIHEVGIKRAGARLTILAMAVALVLIGWVGPFPSTSLSASIRPVAELQESRQQTSALWPHEKSDLASDPSVIFGQLANGFQYVLMENNRPEDRVS